MNRPRMNKALKQYNTVNVGGGVESATPHRLVQMLLEGALEKLVRAKGALEHNEIARKGEYIGLAISIIGGLRGSLDLDKGGEIADNLDSLYEYMVRRLTEANINNDAEPLSEVQGLLLEIKFAWDAMPAHIKTGVPENAKESTA